MPHAVDKLHTQTFVIREVAAYLPPYEGSPIIFESGPESKKQIFLPLMTSYEIGIYVDV